MLAKYKQFMLESNSIEGEKRVNPNDVKAVNFALVAPLTNIGDLLHLHRLLGEYLKKDWVGKFRTVDVQVGNFRPLSHFIVPEAMDEYIKELPLLDSWDAHNRFEKIHPFQDLNGRVGRLIWLSKAVNEGYNFSIPFLQAFYYQTLSRHGVIAKLPQRQDDLTSQLQDVVAMANKIGCYDAADFITENLRRIK